MAYNKTPNNEAPELIEKVVYLNRVSKTVKGGRVMKFSALVVVGDGKGTVGYGLGKAAEVSEAILKGIADAKKNMVKVSLAGDTIPHDVIGIFGAGKVLMKPAPEGTGLVPLDGNSIFHIKVCDALSLDEFTIQAITASVLPFGANLSELTNQGFAV